MIRKFTDIISKKAFSVSRNMLFFLCLATVCLISFDCWAEDNECPDMETLKERYMNGCVPCQVVKVLLTAFMRASANVYDISREAGTKLLLIGSAIWVAFWALKKVSSLTNPEPMAMMNELLIFFGKVLFAFVFINSGVGTLIGYAINPVIAAGADYGTALISAGASSMAHPIDLSVAPEAKNSYDGPTDIVSKKVMDKILRFSEAASYEVTNNMIIGSALTCFSVQAGSEFPIIHLQIPDIWLWLCGAVIWIIGFLLTLAICYYLVDIPFKLGFAVIALPVVIGLWPFKITQGKLRSVIMIAVNAAGTFLFLSLSVSYAMILISTSLQDQDRLFEAFEKDDVTYVKDLFAITGSHFLLILFCYVYGFKMIGHFTNKMPNKLFGGSMTAAAGSPIHHMATAATNWLKQKTMAPVKLATDIVANQAGKAATTVAKAAGNVGLGAAAYSVGGVGRGLGKATSFVGRKMANAGRNAQAQYEQDIREGGIRDTASQQWRNRIGAQMAGAFGKTGELIDRVGKKGDNLSKHIQTPGLNTANRIKNAAIASGQAWKEALDDVSDPTATWNRVSRQEIRRLAIQRRKSREASGKVATYVPGGALIQKAGLALQRKAKTDSSNVVAKAMSKFANSYGKHLERKGAFIAAHKAEQGTHRAKLKNDFGKSLGEENQNAILGGLSQAKSSLREGFKRDWEKVKQHAESFRNSKSNFKQNYKDTLKSNITQLGDSAAGLGKAFVQTPGRIIKDAGNILKTMPHHEGMDGEFKATTEETLSRAKLIAANIARNLDPLQNVYKEGMGFIDKHSSPSDNALDAGLVLTGAVVKGAVVGGVKDAANLALTVPAAALGLGIMGKDVANTVVEGAYSTAMHAAFIGIDIAKLATVPLVKNTADVLGHAGATVGDFGKVAASAMALGQATNVVGSALNTAGAFIKAVVKYPLRGVGGTVGFAAKMVDNTLYTAYRATVTPTLAVGDAALQGVKLGYRQLSATTLGKGVRAMAHDVRGTLKVGLRTIQIGTNIIKAAAGDGSRRPARKLTPEEKARLEEEKKKRREEERRRRQEQERREQEERRRELDDMRRQMENERQQQNNLRDSARDEFNRRVLELQNEMSQRLSASPANRRQQLRTTLMAEYSQRLSEIRNELMNRT